MFRTWVAAGWVLSFTSALLSPRALLPHTPTLSLPHYPEETPASSSTGLSPQHSQLSLTQVGLLGHEKWLCGIKMFPLMSTFAEGMSEIPGLGWAASQESCFSPLFFPSLPLSLSTSPLLLTYWKSNKYWADRPFLTVTKPTCKRAQ